MTSSRAPELLFTLAVLLLLKIKPLRLQSTVTDGIIVTYLLNDVGHTVPVCQFDVVTALHQALVALRSNFQTEC